MQLFDFLFSGSPEEENQAKAAGSIVKQEEAKPENATMKKQMAILGVIWLMGVGYRFVLWEHFFGWEESDYGNLAMVRGVWDSGFTHFDMNHMPGYYALGACFLFLTQNTVVAAKLASWLGGSVALGLSMGMVYRLAGYFPALVTAVLLLFQPEFSLYSASALREPVYSALMMAFLCCLLWKHYWLAGICGAMAFFFRFEAPVAIAPLLLLLAWKKEYRAVLSISLPLLGAIVLWGMYCHQVHGTFQFWAHAAATNVQTGLGAEATSSFDWIFRGADISFSLLAWVLPSRIGWLIWAGWLMVPLFLVRTSRWVWIVLLSFSMVFLWAAIAFVAQHDAVHNLYWKWLCPFVPIVVPVGVLGLVLLSSNWSRKAQGLLWGIAITQALIGHYQESQRQIQRSVQLYKPQLNLAQDIEANAPRDRLMLVDNIPACWIGRKEHELQLISWFDVPVPKRQPEAFAAWLIKNKIWAVLWFQEDWTQAPIIAPFLSEGGVWERDGVKLIEIAREDAYGWIYFRTDFTKH